MRGEGGRERERGEGGRERERDKNEPPTTMSFNTQMGNHFLNMIVLYSVSQRDRMSNLLNSTVCICRHCVRENKRERACDVCDITTILTIMRHNNLINPTS